VEDTAKTEANATVHQDTTIETGTETGISEIVTEIATGIVMVVVVEEEGGMTDVSPLERDTIVILEIMMTIQDVLPIMKMTVAGISVVTAKKIVAASEEGGEAAEVEAPLAKTHEMATAADVVNRTKMALPLQKEDRRPPKVLCRCHRGEGRPLDGTCVHLDMNNIRPAKLNKQVRLPFDYVFICC
jgi:hypothetical protein